LTGEKRTVDDPSHTAMHVSAKLRISI